MEGSALKKVVATAVSGGKPSDEDALAAIAEGLEIALGFFADVRKIATALDRLAGSVDEGWSIRVKNQN